MQFGKGNVTVSCFLTGWKTTDKNGRRPSRRGAWFWFAATYFNSSL